MSNVKTDLQITMTNMRKNSNQHKKCENCEVILMNILHVKSDPKLFEFLPGLSFHIAEDRHAIVWPACLRWLEVARYGDSGTSRPSDWWPEAFPNDNVNTCERKIITSWFHWGNYWFLLKMTQWLHSTTFRLPNKS